MGLQGIGPERIMLLSLLQPADYRCKSDVGGRNNIRWKYTFMLWFIYREYDSCRIYRFHNKMAEKVKWRGLE